MRRDHEVEKGRAGALILVGPSACLHEVASDLTFDDLGEEGFVIETRGPHLIIAGGRPRGTLYGVYTFLEDYVGCRWYTSRVSHIPIRAELLVGPLKERQVPALEYRDVFYYDAFDGDWAVRNKCNGVSARLDAKRGGKIVYKGFVHTFYQFVPPEEFFDEHPEYFSEIDGKRVWEKAQLCLTNPELAGVVAQHVREWLRESPEARIVSIAFLRQTFSFSWRTG